ncbi:MAG: hypothetical protein ACFCU6_15975 [Balneolaceae bacterium]
MGSRFYSINREQHSCGRSCNPGNSSPGKGAANHRKCHRYDRYRPGDVLACHSIVRTYGTFGSVGLLITRNEFRGYNIGQPPTGGSWERDI